MKTSNDKRHLEFAKYRLKTWLEYRRDHSLNEGSRRQANERIKLWIKEIRNLSPKGV